MPLDYNPKDAETAWPKAQYPAELKGVVDTVSKSSQAPMQEWHWLVFDDANNRQQTIIDYFVPPKGTFKLRMLAQALNRAADFKAGKFQADEHMGARVMLSLVIENHPDFGDKNRVKGIYAITQPQRPAAQPARQTPRQPAPVASGGYSGEEQPTIKGEDIPF